VKQTIFEKHQSSPKPSYFIPRPLADLILEYLSLLMVFQNDTQALAFSHL
jgi:hypothetical protein